MDILQGRGEEPNHPSSGPSDKAHQQSCQLAAGLAGQGLDSQAYPHHRLIGLGGGPVQAGGRPLGQGPTAATDVFTNAQVGNIIVLLHFFVKVILSLVNRLVVC